MAEEDSLSVLGRVRKFKGDLLDKLSVQGDEEIRPPSDVNSGDHTHHNSPRNGNGPRHKGKVRLYSLKSMLNRFARLMFLHQLFICTRDS